MRDLTLTRHPLTKQICLHGYFTSNDMEWLLSPRVAPGGEFTPDFRTTKSSKMGWLHYMQLRASNGFLGRPQLRPFWFTYQPEHRITLLTALYLRGLLSPEQEKVA